MWTIYVLYNTIGGDFNTYIARSKSFNTNNFEEFLEKENLVNCMNHVLSDIDFMKVRLMVSDLFLITLLCPKMFFL